MKSFQRSFRRKVSGFAGWFLELYSKDEQEEESCLSLTFPK